jgi:MFS transporter, DHA2 family, multidrug resistance protein
MTSGPPTTTSGAYRWLVMLMAMVATICAVLSATIINVAIPDIMGSFGIEQVDAQWLAAGFLAATTTTMVLVDYASKMVGQKPLMVAALTTFLLASLMGGFAEETHTLIASRIIQGAAAGFMQPLSMIAVFQVFPPEQRGRAMGVYGLGAVLSPALGPYFGGFLVEALSWRYVFFVGVPLASLGIALTLAFMPTPERKGPRPTFDFPAFVLLVTFLVCVLTAFTDGPRDGWNDTSVVIRFVVGSLSAVGFVVWEKHAPNPMLDVSIYTRPAFAGATIVNIMLGAGLFGSTYMLPLFVQTIQGLTPTLAGAILLPAGLSMMVLTPLTGRLADRINPGVQVSFGLLMFVISFYLLSFADVRTTAITLALLTMISRAGMGFIFPALSAGGVRALPPELLAQGAASMNFTRQLSGAFGVNLLAVFLEDRTQTYASRLAATQTPGNAASEQYVAQVSDLALPLGLSHADAQGVAVHHLSQALHDQAVTMAFQSAYEVGAVVFVFSLIGGVLMARGRPHGA